jgi:hypothetical protein
LVQIWTFSIRTPFSAWGSGVWLLSLGHKQLFSGARKLNKFLINEIVSGVTPVTTGVEKLFPSFANMLFVSRSETYSPDKHHLRTPLQPRLCHNSNITDFA